MAGSHALPADIRANLAARFLFQGREIYGAHDNQNVSPLYAALCEDVALDPALLWLVRDADRSTQIPNLLFAAVQFLLLDGPAHPLARFYRSFRDSPEPPAQAFPEFREFCLSHAAAVETLVNTRRVQTNETRRAACLLPALELVSRRNGGAPLALVEIGSSAGLHLRIDQYFFDYGRGARSGDPESPLHITCEATGGPLPLPAGPLRIASRVGIDLHPIDIDQPDQVRWLRALIWPEHVDRAQRLGEAIAIAQRHPVSILQGGADELIESVVASLPGDAALCVFHSFTLNQCSAAVRGRILARLDAIAQIRPFQRVAFEWFDGQPGPLLTLITHTPGGSTDEVLADCESHGRRIHWPASPSRMPA